MTKAEKKQYKLEVRQQRKEFARKLGVLFQKKYRASMRYEDALVLDDGKAYVNVDLTKLDSPFSVFSYNKRMDPEIYDYIDKQVFYLRAAIPVVINFDDGGKYSTELKDKIRKNVIRHYTLDYEDKRLEHKKSIAFAAILMLIGVVFLGIHFLSVFVWKNKTAGDVINEITLIMSWMFVWQGCDFMFISGHSKRVEIMNAGQLALAEITFGPPKQ